MKGEREHSYPHTQTPFVMSTAASFLQIAKRDSSDLSWHVRRIKIPIRCKTRLERKVSARSKNLAWYRTYHDNWQWHFRGGWLLVIVKGCVSGLVETGHKKIGERRCHRGGLVIATLRQEANIFVGKENRISVFSRRWKYEALAIRPCQCWNAPKVGSNAVQSVGYCAHSAANLDCVCADLSHVKKC